MEAPKTLQQAIRDFSDPDRCLEFMVSIRWPDGVKCPTCGSKEVSFLATRRVWKCKTKHAKQQFSVKVGTVFEDSPVGLDKWFAAVWMVANCKNLVSSYEIHRALGVTQKTAWFMDHRVRLAMQTGTFEKIAGEFEVDESFIGGLARFMHKDKKAKITGTGGAGKAIVMGLLDRKTKKIRLRHVPNTQRETLQGVVRQYIQGGSYIYSDAWVAYNGLNHDYVHQVIDHAESYVQGNVHTNGIENFWSLLKRDLKGTYISVEPFHLFRYLDEQAFRFNERKANDGERFVMTMQGITGKRLTYEKLTGKEEAAPV
ncbi:MAG: IS1595 family transposase [Candidatus Binatus sp.]|uniref:IS1595 family transposase n=1 Tax=Candidatus Binatus sp. TaxID=2811406 RepID=UPI00271732E2|nr:IS1595 family transposase [Candidatus Binatus sp.]MDO8432109.1 IS1595 family transposase [Candidatus Binatus sp.]